MTMPGFDRGQEFERPAATPQEQTCRTLYGQIPTWDRWLGTDFQARCLRERRDLIVGYTRRDGAVVDGELDRARELLDELEERAKALCKTIPALKRLRKGSDLGWGSEYRGVQFINEQVRKQILKLRGEVATYQRELGLIEQGLRLYEKHLVTQEAEKKKRKEASRASKLRQDHLEYLRDCKDVPVEAERLIRAVLENPFSISPTVMQHPIMAYVVGKAGKDLHVRRRYLEDKGIKDLPEVPRIRVPEGFRENLEKILNRKLHRDELLRRESRWYRMEQQYKRDDARAELARIEKELEENETEAVTTTA